MNIDRLAVTERALRPTYNLLRRSIHKVQRFNANRLVTSLRRVSTSIQTLRRPIVSVAVLTSEKCAKRTLLASRSRTFTVPNIQERSRIVRLIPGGSRRLRPFYSKRFHALLNSLFKVLFNFPSRYLFAIGLVVIFSFRRGLPSALGYTLK
jgi:hypothetical protein